MAKKKAPTEARIVPMYSPAQTEQLSELEQTFNQLIVEVDKLREKKANYEKWMEDVRQFEAKHHNPLREQMLDWDVKIALALDQALASKPKGLSKHHRELLESMLEKNVGDLVIEHGCEEEEIIALFERLYNTSAEEAKEEYQEELAEMIQEQAEQAFGMEFDFSDVTDFSNMQEVFASVIRQLDDAGVENMEEVLQGASQGQTAAKPPKQAKKQESAVESPDETEPLPKVLKGIYNQLVKHFHPDLEADEGERLRKTAIMQEITASYEKGDFFNLLRMQWELSDKSGSVPEQKLKGYVSMLSEQRRALHMATEMLRNPPPPFEHYREYFRARTQKGVEKKLKEQTRALEFVLRNKESVWKDTHSVRGLKVIADAYNRSMAFSMESLLDMFFKQ
jgi:hypothetical protein